MVTALTYVLERPHESTGATNSFSARLDALDNCSMSARARTETFISIAIHGLPQLLSSRTAARTGRGILTPSGLVIRPEGEDLRYAAIVALGLSCVDEQTQKQILDGNSAVDLARNVVNRVEVIDELGAVALAAWAAGEVANLPATGLFERLLDLLKSGKPIETVVCAWALAAAVSQLQNDSAQMVCELAAQNLRKSQSKAGLFPHILPANSAGPFRSHVGCFADQVYPIQALSRLAVATSDKVALDSANRCAARICDLQGQAGQWWWHYDVRNGSVVEGYPVYSVHQHAMAPMALLDLYDAGGADHMRSIVKGLSWLDQHPEARANLVSEWHGVIWRKIGRREPAKFIRKISALTTSMARNFRLPGLDKMFPPNQVDYECRPYEFGWLLYAWLFRGFNKY